jgi:hypothetical protein
LNTPLSPSRHYEWRSRLALLGGLWLLLSCSSSLAAQEAIHNYTEANRLVGSLDLDGTPDESIWQSAPRIDNFTTLRPVPGRPASQEIDVRILYDDIGLYVGAYLYDTAPDSILMELTERDQLGNTDFFGFVIDAYQSGINGFTFITTPADVQFDAKQEEGNEDSTWDAVWTSRSTLQADGWSTEIFIPYSALRFPEKTEQIWTINFVRMIQRDREQSFWSEIDPQIDGFLNQSGTLAGIRDIKPPVRLQLTPFVAMYGQKTTDPTSADPLRYGRSVNGGMDVKWGLNDAFTLDMTLIPDFGEARSDDQILNLGPFEQRFDEQRAFFTEGTELFNKGGLFYSRRVGGNPYYAGAVADKLTPEERLTDVPQRMPLYNATKVSGRTAGGTGIGVFNAVERRVFARVVNEETGTNREVLINPLTNYNVMVADQNLPNNSSVSLINTNVWREGAATDANATALVWDLHNKPNVYAFSGSGKLSQRISPEITETGHAFDLNLRKISGKWQGRLGYGEESDTYDINDLGLLFNNNSRNVTGFLEFNQFEPFWNGRFLNGGSGLFLRHERLYNPNVHVATGGELWVYAQTKQQWRINLWTGAQLTDEYDYFEPRVKGRFWRSAGRNNVGFFLRSDDRKKLRVMGNANFSRWRQAAARNRLNYFVDTRYRFSDRLSLSLSLERSIGRGDIGYVNQQQRTVVQPDQGVTTVTDVFMGTRDRQDTEVSLEGKYSFTANMTLNLRVRHYWATVEYDRFHLLGETDGLLYATAYDQEHDIDYDAFNVDLIYRWRFAPGSDIFFVYKSNLSLADSRPTANYWNNFRTLWEDNPRQASLSLKVVYWLDYASLVQ